MGKGVYRPIYVTCLESSMKRVQSPLWGKNVGLKLIVWEDQKQSMAVRGTEGK